MKKKIAICFMTCFILVFLQSCGTTAVVAPSADQGTGVEDAASQGPDGSVKDASEDKSEDIQKDGETKQKDGGSGQEDDAAGQKDDAGQEDDDARQDEATQQGETDLQTPDLKEILADKAGVDDSGIAFIDQDDFDGDGTEEAFAIVGTRTEFDEDPDTGGTIEGGIWFVSEKECTMLSESSGMGFVGEDRIMTLGGTNYIMFDEAYATGALTYVWNVSDGKAVDSKISMIGTVITDPGSKDEFCIKDSSYDLEYDAEMEVTIGHTWKDYYFYYDEKEGSIREYGGTDIDSKTAEALCGRPFPGDLLQPGDKPKEIFYRGNGLVVLNLERPDGNNILYQHYIYDIEKGCFIDDDGNQTQGEPLDGTYLKALCPEIATYPEIPAAN